MLTAHGLACDRGDRRLFSAVDFAVAQGQWLQVEGPNGAGTGGVCGAHVALGVYYLCTFAAFVGRGRGWLSLF